MVSDAPRTDAFAAAIKEAIKGGETVIDVGTGSGLLAMLAANAGAKKVYALDQARIADAARESVERNGLSDTVEVLNANATDFQLAEPVDLIVSEWLGHFAYVENMLDDLLVCRDANLKEGGRMLPAKVELALAPICSDFLYNKEGPGYWQQSVHGIDFSHLESRELQQALAVKTQLYPSDLLAEGKPMFALDLVTASKDDVWQSGELTFTAEKDGEWVGFGGWFVADLTATVTLDTGPHQELTHWMQTYFPMRPQRVKAGETIQVKYQLERHYLDPRSIIVHLEAAGQRYQFSVT